MKSKIKLKSGTELFLEYVYMDNHLLEIKPCSISNDNIRTYLNDGYYELENGYFTIADKKITYINYG